MAIINCGFLILMILIRDVELCREKSRDQSNINKRIISLNEYKIEVQKIIAEIRKPSERLSDDIVDYLLENLNNAQQTYKFGSVFHYNATDFYQQFSTTTRDDIQILSGGRLGHPNAISHYICICYRHRQHIVYIYDSLFRLKITKRHREIMQKLYPAAIIYKHKKPATLQHDSTSSGLFAIAYATMLILGKDPTTYELKLNTTEGADQGSFMREHLIKMLQAKKLSLFPSTDQL
ncbi:uncharacterized protein LOC116346029 [Contarinia nasturtii]|uniref:uncharacterized protein LOC116346029 n=1 Tax=Contarinia nasturtii TaxID=265458 RepID=UPI0012D454DF|nr:uncharacterized protein LOC116346029 [Contarinia nasturtii]